MHPLKHILKKAYTRNLNVEAETHQEKGMSKPHLYIRFQPFGVKSILGSQTERIRRHLSSCFFPVVRPASKTETLKTNSFSVFYKDLPARVNAAKRTERGERSRVGGGK